MLQQTRVETVIPYYQRFLAAFPTMEDLARADEQQVYKAWEGLGYYSRARNLHRCARQVVAAHAGAMPRDVAELEALPGIGRYTAGAVASIAFDVPAPIVDGNVKRVLARLVGIDAPVNDPRHAERFWSLAKALLDRAQPGDFNQGLMELGATVCTPRTPGCAQCPLQTDCFAARNDRQQDLPRKNAKKASPTIHAAAAVIVRNSKVLVVRRPAHGLLAGLWELPTVASTSAHDAQSTLRDRFPADYGLTIEPTDSIGTIKHVFTHRTLYLHVHACEKIAGRVKAEQHADHRWAGPRVLQALAFSRLGRKSLDLLARAPE